MIALIILLLLAIILVVGALLLGLVAGGASITVLLLIIGFIAIIIKAVSNSNKNRTDNQIIISEEETPDYTYDNTGFIIQEAEWANNDKKIVVRYVPTADRDMSEAIEVPLERAFIALNVFQFDEATFYFDRVLDIDPHFAPAYLGKLLCSLSIRDEQNLPYAKYDFTQDSNWDLALRFATEEELSRYNGYAEKARAERDKLKKWEIEERIRIQRDIAEEQVESGKRKKKIVLIICAIVLLCIVAIYLANIIIIPSSHYNKAATLAAAGKWNEAVDEYRQAGAYKDAEMKIIETWYLSGIAKQEKGDYDGALIAFEKVNDYKDAKNRIDDIKYQQAKDVYDSGDYDEAYLMYLAIENVKDVSTILYDDSHMQQAAKHRKWMDENKVKGCELTFGTYEQDNDTSNGKESLEWIVLDEFDNDIILMITKYGIEETTFNSGGSNATWANCSLREWLNNDFIDTAFNPLEKKAIVQTLVSTDGSNTSDKAFLLSVNEAKKYFPDKKSLPCIPTEYAKEEGKRIYGVYSALVFWDNHEWWLRTTEATDKVRAYYASGSGYDTYLENNPEKCVRPAICVDLRSGVFKNQK